MDLHIGNEIRRVLEEKGITAEWLAQKINTSRRNMYDILKRKEISTRQLSDISRALKHDFFRLYSVGGEEPAKYERRKEVVMITVPLDGLQTTLNQWISKLQEINKVI